MHKLADGVLALKATLIVVPTTALCELVGCCRAATVTAPPRPPTRCAC